MDTLLWVCRALHVFSVALWCGGLLYQAVVAFPILKLDAGVEATRGVRLLRRFVPVAWMAAWTMLVTGFALLLFNPRFIFFRYADAWSVTMGVKQLVFVMMMFFGLGYSRMLSRIARLLANDDAGFLGELPLATVRLLQFHRVNVALAIVAILLSASLK